MIASRSIFPTCPIVAKQLSLTSLISPLGILIALVSLLIPIFGWLFYLGMVITGMGAAVITLLPERKKRQKNEPVGEMEEPEPPSLEMVD